MTNYTSNVPSFVAEPLARNNTRLLALLILHLSSNSPVNSRSLAALAKKLNHLLYMTNISTVSLVNAIRFFKLVAVAHQQTNSLEKPSKSESTKSSTLLCRFIACLSISNKTYDDSSFTNSTWSQLSKIPLQKINAVEISYLQTLDYNVFSCCFNTVDYTNWIHYLDKMGQYLNIKYYDLLNVKNPIHKKCLNSKKPVVSSRKRLSRISNGQAALLTPPYFSSTLKNSIDNTYNNNNTVFSEGCSLPSLSASVPNYTNPFFTSPESITSNENIVNTISSNGNVHGVTDFHPLVNHANVAPVPIRYDFNDNFSQMNRIPADNTYTQGIPSSRCSSMALQARQVPQQFSHAACMPLPVLLPPLHVVNNNINTTSMYNGYVQNNYKENMNTWGYPQSTNVPFSLSTSYSDLNLCNLNYQNDFNPAYGSCSHGYPCESAITNGNFSF